LDAETKSRKSSRETVIVGRDRETLKTGAKIPAEMASFQSMTVSAVREDWMVADAVKRNRSPTKNREFSRNSSPKQVSDVPMAAGRSNFDRDSNQLYKQ